MKIYKSESKEEGVKMEAKLEKMLTKKQIEGLKKNDIFNLEDLQDHCLLPPIYMNPWVFDLVEILIDKGLIYWTHNETIASCLKGNFNESHLVLKIKEVA